MSEETKNAIITMINKSGSMEEVAEHIYHVSTAIWEDGRDYGLKRGALCGAAIVGGCMLAYHGIKYFIDKSKTE